MNKEEILRKINELNWFHSFELLPGIITPGRCRADAKTVFDSFKLPQNLSGLKALDVGAWDGPYSFELENRGADVIALDIQDPDCTGFNTAKEILQSKVKYVQASVYDLTKVLSERFDIVLFLGVYYHLKCPVFAFEQISSVLKDDGLLLIEGECLRNWAPDPDKAAGTKNPILEKSREMKKNKYVEKLRGRLILKSFSEVEYFCRDFFRPRPSKFVKSIAKSNVPITLFYSGKYKQDPSNWFVPNFACIREWLSEAGLNLVIHSFDDERIPNQRFCGVAKKLKESKIPIEHGILKKNDKN